MFGMFERHLWLSLWERPAHSRFSRAQRVTCSALTLHLYLALAALWYSAVGAAAQRLENQNPNHQNVAQQMSESVPDVKHFKGFINMKECVCS